MSDSKISLLMLAAIVISSKCYFESVYDTVVYFIDLFDYNVSNVVFKLLS